MEKQKYLIEIGKTKNNCVDVYGKGNYPGPGFYLNTDETDYVTLVFIPAHENNCAIGICDYVPEKEIQKAIGEPYTPVIMPEIPAPPPLEIPEMPDIEIVDSISQDTFLKALAVGLKPELIISLVKVNE